jgi:non-specific serine/threonine protein kinase
MAEQISSLMPGSFPISRPRLIGRESETAAITSLLRLADVRLVSITGPGGVGKTCLARHLAHERAIMLPIATAFVELAPVIDATLVGPSIAAAIGLSNTGRGHHVEALIAHLQDREFLLVLDNFEHVLAAAPVLAGLLTHCPRLKLLVTSRARLRLSGERTFPLMPLRLPPAGHVAVVDVAAVEAVRLFVERAEAVDPAFTLTATNAAAVAEICRRLDGLPLAIELAAARIDVLPPAAMLTRLDRQLPLLTGGPRDAPVRLQTMRAAIAWSYEVLSPAEQALFRRLAVFPGGVSLEAATWVADDLPRGETAGLPPRGPRDSSGASAVFERISVLCHMSLLHAVDAATSEPRYAMLHTLREFGMEQLEAAEEIDAIRHKQGEYFAALARQTDPLVSESYEDQRWLDQIEMEDDNLWSVLTWSLESSHVEVGLRLADAISQYWYLRKRRLTEARIWLDRALESGRRAGVPDRVLALALSCASTLAHLQDDADQAVALAEESLGIFERLGASVSVARVRYILAIAVYMHGDCGRAERLYHEAIAQLRAEDDRYFVAEALLGAAQIALDHGDQQRAAAAYTESLQISQRLGSKSCAAMAQSGLGFLARSRGEPVAAHQHFQDSLSVWCEIADPASIAVCLEALASTVCSLGAPQRAARLLGAAEALREQSSYPIPHNALPTYQQVVTAIQAALSMRQFATAWVEGRALSVAEAVALAREDLPQPDAGSALQQERPQARWGLTERELEVLRLLAQGLTDREIADTLFISRRTASDHVSHILRKLVARSRSDAAALAVRQGLG